VGADILLITSRTRSRWLIPKGWPIEGKSAELSAMQEAFEEAGVIALRTDAMVGTYQYSKELADGSLLPCTVDVFAIRSPRLLDAWPEMEQRKRRWYGVEAAAAQVAEPALSELLRSFGAGPARDATGPVAGSVTVRS
jgi:8-oxo-dGTP pyrophosphatase MutT (NUDIX family)